MGINMSDEKERAAAQSRARMARNLEDRQRAYGPRLTPDGEPKPAPIRLSELKKLPKRKRKQPWILVETEGQPRFEGGCSWVQGGLPSLGKDRKG